VACTISTAAFIEHTWRFPDGGWDAWMVWNLRARFLFRGGEGFRAAFSPEMLFFAHQDYPFLVPGIVARSFALVGRETQLVPVAVAAFFGALAVALVTLSTSRMHGGRRGVFAGLAIATLPCFPIFTSNQQSDVPLSVYVLLCAALLEWDACPLAGFCAGLGAWTKNEGAMMLAFFALALLWRTRDGRKCAAFVLGALPLLALLAFYKLDVAPMTDLAALSTRATLLQHAVDPRRWGEVVLLVLRRLVYFQDFGLWLVAEAVVLWSLRKRKPDAAGTALLLSGIAFVPIYVLQPHPLGWIFRTSADRLIMQLWPAVVLSTATALAQPRTTART
jgi:4-amino-4-deoxy-L-arabinose transferase-like glycosyltransferase